LEVSEVEARKELKVNDVIEIFMKIFNEGGREGRGYCIDR
jgi:hypothetical protein